MELQTQVAQAVHILNHDVHSCNRVAANQWLVQFQYSDAAWDVTTRILTSDPLPGFELHLFAAQILKRKVQNEGVALQAEYRSALQAALLVSAKKFSAGPPQLLTQICLALSALVLRAVELKKPVEQLFASLCQTHDGVGSYAILELLTVLPEEVIEDNIVNATVEPERRWHFTQELLSHTGIVLEFLLQQTKDETGTLSELHGRHKKVLRSLLSWVRAGCFLEIPQSSRSSHPLLYFVYDSLLVPALFGLAVEVLVELVSRHEGLPQVLLLRMQSIKDALLLPALAKQDDSVVAGLACLLAEIGQAATPLIAEGGSEAIILTNSLLRCVAYSDQDWEIADSTLNFWCTLAEFILGLSNEEQKKTTVTAFAPIYTILLDALFLRAKVVVYNTERDQTANIPDELVRFRRNLEELLADICYFLGPAEFLAKVLNGSWATVEAKISWEMVEVRLFTLNLVAEIVLECEQQFDLSIITGLITALHMAQTSAASSLMHLVYKSAAEVVGSFSKLLCPNATAVLPILLFLASGMQISAASSSSALALRKLCEEVPYISNDSCNLEGLLWIGEGLHKLSISLREEEDAVSAIGHVLAAINNEEMLNLSLNRVLKPSHEAIDALLKTDIKGPGRLRSSAYAITLEGSVRALTRLGIIFRHLSVSNKAYRCGKDPVFNVLHYFWPLLESMLASCHMENSSLAAAVCRCLSFIIQASGQQFFTSLSEVMVALCKNFISVQSNECFVRTAAVALEEFGHKEELGSLFIRTFSAFSEAEVVSAMNSSYACDQEPDIVEAFMSFTSTFLCCCPKKVVVAAGGLLETSFSKATIWCTAMHRGAALAAMSYISRFLEAGASCLMTSGIDMYELSLAELCLRVCSECGESTIRGMLYALLGVSAMTRVHKAATIIQQLAAICYFSESMSWKLKLGWGSLQNWLTNVVHALPTEYLKSGEAEQMISSWLKAMEVASAEYYNSKGTSLSGGGYMQGQGGRSLKRIVREFADVHRHIAPSFGSM